MKSQCIVPTFLVGLLFANPLSAQGLLKDIATNPRTTPPSQPSRLISVGGDVLVVAARSVRPRLGIELFRTDGTPGSLRLLQDFDPGRPSSSPSGFLKVGTDVYFGADMEVGYERGFFRYSGTTRGLRLLYTIGPTLVGGSEGFARAGTTNYLTGDYGALHAFQTGPGPALGSVDRASGATDFGGELLFNSNGEPFLSDGTLAGTRRLVDIHPTGNSNPANFVTAGALAFFAATEPGAGREVWRTDGTSAGTVLVADLRPGSGGSDPRNLFAVGTDVYFTANDGTTGRELWRVQGLGSPVRLADIAPGASGSAPEEMTSFAGKVFFAATDGSGDRELWETDGTPAGTVRFADLNSSGSSAPKCLTVSRGRLYFGVERITGLSAPRLMVSDGTVAGTVPAASFSLDVSQMVAKATGAGEVVLIGSNGSGSETWASSGTTATTVFLGSTNHPVGATEDANPGPVTAISDYAVFSATTAPLGRELYETDGTDSGTNLLADINPGPADSSPGDFKVAGDSVYFAATTAAGREPHWYSRSQGLRTFDIHPTGSSDPSDFTSLGHAVYFLANDTQGRGLFRTDGTASGTVRVSSTQEWRRIDRVGQRLFLENSLGFLWVSDGTAAGTRSVGSTVRPTSTERGALGDRYFFVVRGTVWVSDGTAGGTKLVKDLSDGRGGSIPTGFQAHRGFMYMYDAGTTVSRGVFRTDGTTAGTQQLVSQRVYGLQVTPDGLFYTSPTDIVHVGLYRANFDGSAPVRLSSHGDPNNALRTDILSLRSHGSSGYVSYVVVFYNFGGVPFAEQMWVSKDLQPAQQVTQLPETSVTSGSAPSVVNGNWLVPAHFLRYGREMLRVPDTGVPTSRGGNCAGAGSSPRLRSSRLAVGQTPTLILDSGKSMQDAVVLFGLPLPVPVQLPGGCQLMVNVSLPTFSRTLRLDAAGSQSLSLVRLPTSAGLVGAVVGVQAGLGPSTTALGIDLTNGLRVVVGR